MSLLEEMTSNEYNSVFDEVAVVVVAYCLASAFLVKNRQYQILPSHFLQMLNYMDRDSVTFTNMETASNTFDLITVNVDVSDEARRFIIANLTDRNGPHFALVRNILKYINEDRIVNGLVSQITNNGVQNTITIDSDYIGGAGQGTAIMIDNELINLSTSIVPMINRPTPCVGIGQNDLATDYGFEAQRNFIRSNFDIDIGSDSSLYYQRCHNNGSPTCDSIEDATRCLYDDVCKRINQGYAGALDTSPMDSYKSNALACAMRQCYGVEPDCETNCVRMSSRTRGFDSFNPSHMSEELYDMPIQATSAPMGNPSIVLSNKNTGQQLFKTRFKKESYPKNLTGYRYKMYFEPASRK
jgi:hypothetical protein